MEINLLTFQKKQFKKQNMISLDSLRGNMYFSSFGHLADGLVFKESQILKRIYKKSDNHLKISGMLGAIIITVLENLRQTWNTWPQIIDYLTKIKETVRGRGIPGTLLINHEENNYSKKIESEGVKIKIDSFNKYSSKVITKYSAADRLSGGNILNTSS